MDNFTLANNFYEDKVNEVMDSTSNIFFHHSPLFQSLNSDRKINKSRNNDRDKFSIPNLKTARNFRNVNILKKISFSLSPSIEDKEKLTSYYKTTIIIMTMMMINLKKRFYSINIKYQIFQK